MQINGTFFQAQDFISLPHQTVLMSGFILFHALGTGERCSIASDRRIEYAVENYFP
jgi:hypothetical protein